MSNYLTFDIETGALPNAAESFDPSTVKLGNIKDEAKVQAKIDEARMSHVEKAALYPETGKVLAVGFSDGEVRECLTYESEREIIEETWQRIGDQLMAQRPVTGWNIIAFDFPFLYKRSLLLGIEFPKHIWDINKGYPHSKIVDLMRYWNMGDRRAMDSMDKVARFLGVGRKASGVSGADFGRLFLGSPEDREKAIQYLLNDIAMLEGLTRKILNI